ncbi:MAG TPA: rhomboid family intramembrane serine protease [bacterium]|nr:rhomboid family intramembrane serine protease [bacterium]
MAARNRLGKPGRNCPVCGRPMREIPAQDGGPPLDVCPTCHFVWFDAQEYELLPPIPARAPDSALPQRAREILALEQVRELHEDAAERVNVPPDEWWKLVPGLFGMPVEYGDQAVRVTPWATWTVAAAIGLAGVLSFRDLTRTVAAFGLIPAEVQRYAGLTLLTSFFIHGSWLHLLVNLYFLLVFGDNVEEYLGAGRYLALLAVATVAGGIAHVALDPRSVVPVIGASGGISGVVAYYVLRFPQARLGLMYVYRWFRIRAYAFGLIWVLLQVIAAREQIAGIGDVSALAHLGGAAVGVWFWAIWTRS